MQKKPFSLLLIFTCLLSGTLVADNEVPPNALLDQSMRLLSESTVPLRIDFDFEGIIKAEGKEETLKQHFRLLFKGKDMLQMTFIEEGKPFLAVYSTGKQWTLYHPVEQFYANINQATTRESFLTMLLRQPFEEGALWLSTFFSHNPSLLDAISESSYAADQTAVRQLLVRSKSYDGTVTLASGEKPWLQAVELDLSSNYADRAEAPTILFKLLNIKIKEDTTITEKDFTFTPSADDYKMSDSMQGPLEAGNKAPPVSLPQLDGEWVKLADHKGKNIVVLDFFATWCGPCRNVMPLVDKVRQNLGGKGVVFYAVNQQESEEQVRGLMQSLNLEMPVLMDQKGLISSAYGVRSIPHMVVIGTDGIIESVHIGGTPDLDTTLTQELKEMLTKR